MKSTNLPMSWVCGLAALAGLAMEKAYAAEGVTASAKWTVAEQPDLGEQLAKAQPLAVEELAQGPRDVTSWTFMLAPNPDGKTWDALQWYFRSYGGPTWLYACDLGTGEVKKQRFPDRRQIHMCGSLIAPDGKLYITTPDWQKGMELYVYDAATNTLEERGVIAPGCAGERRDLALGPDGRIYGTGSYSEEKKAGAYVIDPRTGEVRDYGPVGPSHAPYGAWGYFIGVCDTHIYVSSGKIPWYLVAVEIKTGTQQVLLQTPVGGENLISVSPLEGGALAVMSVARAAEPQGVLALPRPSHREEGQQPTVEGGELAGAGAAAPDRKSTASRSAPMPRATPASGTAWPKTRPRHPRTRPPASRPKTSAGNGFSWRASRPIRSTSTGLWRCRTAGSSARRRLTSAASSTTRRRTR